MLLHLLKKKTKIKDEARVVVHTCNPSTWDVEAVVIKNSRPFSTTYRVQVQAGLHKTLSQKSSKKKKDDKIKTLSLPLEGCGRESLDWEGGTAQKKKRGEDAPCSLPSPVSDSQLGLDRTELKAWAE